MTRVCPTEKALPWTVQSGLSDPAGQIGVNAALGTGATAPAGPPGTNGSNGATGPAGPSVIPSGATGARTGSPATGAVFLDTSLNKPVFYNGTHWVDATGATV